MKLLYLSLAPSMRFQDPSGYGTHMREVASALGAAGHQVVRYVAGNGGLLIGTPEAPNPSLATAGALRSRVPAPVRHVLRDLRELWLDRRAAGELARIVHASGIEAIYERSAFMQLAGIRLASACGLPHVLEVNAPIEERREHHGYPLFAFGVRRERQKLALADQVVCVSSPLRDYLVARGADRERVAVIPNAARPEAFALEPIRRAELRRALGIGEGQVGVGFVGRFGFWRGMGPLMEAIGRAAAATPRAHFVLVGDGQLMPEVRRFVGEHRLGSRVTLTGSVAPAAVPSHVAALDIGVLAGSPWYSSPIKLFEYGAAGLGVVAPRVTPVEEVLEDGVEGLLVPPEQPEAIANAILALAEDDGRRRMLGERFRARVLGTYTWSHVAAGIEALLASSSRRAGSSRSRPAQSAAGAALSC